MRRKYVLEDVTTHVLVAQSIVRHSFVQSFCDPHPFVFGNHDNISSSASAPKRRIYSVAMAI